MAEPAKKLPSRRLMAQAALAIVVSAAALWWAFRDADLDAMRKSLAASDWTAVASFAIGHALIHMLRVWRWQLFMAPIAPQVSPRALYAAANIGIASTFFLPLRLGEFVRPMLIARAGAPFGGAISSIVVERIADGLCAVSMFFFFLSFVPESAPIPTKVVLLSRGAALVFGTGLLVVGAAVVARGPVLGWVRSISRRVSEPIAERLVGLLETFLDGLASLGSPFRAAAYLSLTALYWGGTGVLIWILGVSYHPQLPLLAGLFAVPVVVFAVMIPAGPAFAGTFQLGFVLGLGAFGLPRDGALVVAVVAHALQMLVMALVLGVGFASAEPRQRARMDLSTSQAPSAQAPSE